MTKKARVLLVAAIAFLAGSTLSSQCARGEVCRGAGQFYPPEQGLSGDA